MSERIKPNAEHRIVDGEVVTDSIDEKIQRGKAYSEQKAKELESGTAEPIENESDFEGVDPRASISEGIDLQAEEASFFKKHQTLLLWSLLFVIVMLVLWLTRPDTDWQVQKINDLQNEVAQIKQDNQALQNKVTEQETAISSQIESTLSDPKYQPAISKSDLIAVEKAMQAELEALQSKISALNGQAGDQVEQALAQLKQLSEAAQDSAKPTEEQLKALADLEDKFQAQLQTQLGLVGDKLSELFAFKAEQQVLTKQPPVLKLDMPLDSLQIQQWIVEINTQWLLNGRVAETRQQLLALEQAVSLSDFSYTTQLARLIGQDLGYLTQLSRDQEASPTPKTEALKSAIQKLNPALIKPAEKVDSNSASASEQKGALDDLLNRFSQMITLKKRSEGDDLTEVDELLINDVLQQRLQLLVDRLDWGMQTQSVSVINKAVKDIQQFIKRHYANESAEFSGMLAPFTEVQFAQKSPLSIMRLDELINAQ